ncbi:MAG: hypothetical protein ACP5GH_06730 [Nitrososphaeria archaeon]
MLRFSYIRFSLIFPNGATLPKWIGSAIRGGLGYALKGYVCSPPACPYCRSAPCLFRGVYVPRKEKVGYAQPPKPLAIVAQPFSSEVELRNEETIYLDFVLLGDYIKSFKQLYVGLDYLGRFGIGGERVYGLNRFRIESAYDAISGRKLDGRSEPPEYELERISPLQGKRYMVSSRTPFTGPYPPQTAEAFLKEIWRRLVLLINEYGDGSRLDLPEPKMRYILTRAERVKYRRKSSRSLKTEFDGWMFDSEVDLEGASEAERWLISAGSFLGMGSDFTFGMGFYKLLELPES